MAERNNSQKQIKKKWQAIESDGGIVYAPIDDTVKKIMNMIWEEVKPEIRATFGKFLKEIEKFEQD